MSDLVLYRSQGRLNGRNDKSTIQVGRQLCDRKESPTLGGTNKGTVVASRVGEPKPPDAGGGRPPPWRTSDERSKGHDGQGCRVHESPVRGTGRGNLRRETQRAAPGK